MRDPVAVLKEFYRICKPGGIIAVRDNSSAIVTSLKPDHPAIRWNRAIIVMGKMGSHPEGGRQLETWAKEAGLGADGGRLVTSTSKSFNSSHLVRTTGVAGEQAIQYGMCTKEELASWKEGWEEWEKTEGHEFVFEAREILYWKPEESV
jgi:ubiquinone/menaquinone biosynthesis C-methylase UbiE